MSDHSIHISSLFLTAETSTSIAIDLEVESRQHLRRLCSTTSNTSTWSQNPKLVVLPVTLPCKQPSLYTTCPGSTSSSNSSMGLFAENNIDEGVEIAKMLDPVQIRTEEEFSLLENNTLSSFEVGKEDSFMHCGSVCLFNYASVVFLICN